jgi:UDP-N-acetylmuramate dehydrogenase
MTFQREDAYNELHSYFHERLQQNEILTTHSTFGIGGPADLWISLTSRIELLGLVSLCAEKHWPLLIVGNGTNVLYSDAGIRGIVAHSAATSYHIEENDDETGLLLADAGVSWPTLLHELVPLGWGGLEFGVGIPGTLGGGVISNAGAHNGELGQVLAWIEVLDARYSYASENSDIHPPQVHRYQHNELNLGYRHSRFREQHRSLFNEQGHLVPPQRTPIEPAEIILQLGIHLKREKPATLDKIINQHILYRERTQPQQNSGLIFKNPPGDYAGRLIDLAGMKGYTIGNAQVSSIDPNFIVNLGNARASDVIAIIEETHRNVLAQSGIDLEVEIERRGEWHTNPQQF